MLSSLVWPSLSVRPRRSTQLQRNLCPPTHPAGPPADPTVSPTTPLELRPAPGHGPERSAAPRRWDAGRCGQGGPHDSATHRTETQKGTPQRTNARTDPPKPGPSRGPKRAHPAPQRARSQPPHHPVFFVYACPVSLTRARICVRFILFNACPNFVPTHCPICYTHSEFGVVFLFHFSVLS